MQELMVELAPLGPLMPTPRVSPVVHEGHTAPLLCGTVLFLQVMIASNAVEKNHCESLRIVLDRTVLMWLLLSPN